MFHKNIKKSCLTSASILELTFADKFLLFFQFRLNFLPFHGQLLAERVNLRRVVPRLIHRCIETYFAFSDFRGVPRIEFGKLFLLGVG